MPHCSSTVSEDVVSKSVPSYFIFLKRCLFLLAVLGPQSLIRSGHVFCDEQHILVDFVRRAEPTTDGRVDMQPSSEVLRSVDRGPEVLSEMLM